MIEYDRNNSVNVTVSELAADQIDDAAKVLRDNLSAHSAWAVKNHPALFTLYGAAAEEASPVVGVCAVKYPAVDDDPYANIVFMAVERELQRKHRIGSKLLKHVEDIVRLEAHLKGITIDSYQQAEQFYFNNGYLHTAGRTKPEPYACRDGLFIKELT